MIYRPQFASSTPAGCRDIPFVYTFDSSNTPVLASDINGKTLPYIQLPLESDAPFIWRGIKAGPLRTIVAGVTTVYALANYLLRFRDCYENDMTDNYVPATKYGAPMNPMVINSGELTGPPVPLDAEVYCPAGGVVQAFLQVGTLTSGGGQSYSTSFSLFGVKRYPVGCQ